MPDIFWMKYLNRSVMCYNAYRSGSEEDVISLDNLCPNLYEWGGDVAQRHQEFREMKARKVEEEAQSANVAIEAAMSCRGD